MENSFPKRFESNIKRFHLNSLILTEMCQNSLTVQNILFISDRKTNPFSNVSQWHFHSPSGKKRCSLFLETEKMLPFYFSLPKTDFGRKVKHKLEAKRDAETVSYKHHETLFAGSA